MSPLPGATPRVPQLRDDVPAGHCRWCGEPIDKEKEPRRQTWHGACIPEYLALQPGNLRRRLHERDHGVCAACGLDTEGDAQHAELQRLEAYRRGLAIEARIRRHAGVPRRWDWQWGIVHEEIEVERRHPALRRALQLARGRARWEADHVTALVDGGPNDLANLQTLCVPCHQDKTAQEARDRAQARRLTPGQQSLEATG